eukprot:CAMPEP_0181317914 /NCGR_PEP_ID=MMETSP1101-20121128/16723_1 /TAXON_ID=46948 /ORGANISM="Rhodomonas abbreviata, Strain Caron Lab Isolate" /LENGTH=138 /DNA_ID=CAMNT_0023425341 /DNA_START=112 /DNA_END=525 /DNA_ORIENTATION=-
MLSRVSVWLVAAFHVLVSVSFCSRTLIYDPATFANRDGARTNGTGPEIFFFMTAGLWYGGTALALIYGAMSGSNEVLRCAMIPCVVYHVGLVLVPLFHVQVFPTDEWMFAEPTVAAGAHSVFSILSVIVLVFPGAQAK